MKKFILGFWMFIALTGLALADPITFVATINAPQVSLDEVLQLTLTFSGVNQNIDPVSLPVLNGFTAKYMGPSTSVSIINGDYHSEKSFIYELFPNKVGHFQIPPISATINGQTYTTKPIDVDVVQNTSQTLASNAANQNQGPTAESLKDKVLLNVSVGQTNVYLGQRVPLTIKLLVNDIPIRDIQLPQFDKSGISVDDYQKPLQNTEIVNGVKYDTVEFKTNIYPNHLGDLTLGPVQIQGNILYKTQQSNPFGQDNNPFGADIFNSFFDSYAARPITITSQPIQLHVSPLPEENRPVDFSDAIGQFDFQASVGPTVVKAGDPLTLKMDIKGNGNFKDLKMPEFEAQGFKSYKPQIKNNGDEKTAEQVIIPVAASIKEVPALHFSYFDPETKEYKTISQGPFPIQVSAPSPDQDFKAVGFADIAKETPAGQFSWARLWGHVGLIFKKMIDSIWFWIGVIVVLAVTIVFFGWQSFQKRLRNDPAFARRLKASKEARQALIPAEGYISAHKLKDFYGLLTKVLHDYLANKWHESSAALSTEDILNHLRVNKVEENSIMEVKSILERADFVCFAGLQVDSSQMLKDLAQTKELISRFEKII